MNPKIIEQHSEVDINVTGIVQRIIKHLPPEILDGLEEIVILDKSPTGNAFGCYRKAANRIELYLDGITLWQPWILKKTYLFPYLFVGMCLGHELDHHVNRNNHNIDREASAEANIMKYVYPSLGIFKPAARLISFVGRHYNRLFEKGIDKREKC